MALCLVVGSVALDEVVRLGERLRPGTHLEGRPREPRLGGGAAGTALALAHAGHQVSCVAAIGSDPAGEFLLAELRSQGVDTSAVVRVAGPSTRSLILVEPDGERTVVNLHRCREAGPPVRLLGLRADAVYVRSREAALGPLLRQKLGECLVVAHVPPTEAGSRPAHYLVGSCADLEGGALSAPWALGCHVAGEALRAIVITRGAAGAEAHTARARVAAPAPAVRAVDTTGAGDVFAAGLLHALLAGAPLREALAAAAVWGAAAVACEGLPAREAIAALAAGRA